MYYVDIAVCNIWIIKKCIKNLNMKYVNNVFDSYVIRSGSWNQLIVNTFLFLIIIIFA